MTPKDQARKSARIDKGRVSTSTVETHSNGKPIAVATTTCYEQIQEKPIEWLWQGWIPSGKLAILDGDPGLGKSTMLLDLAARISTHGRMPDMTNGRTGAIIIMSAEDAAGDTIKPRLIAAKANLSKIHDMSEITIAESRSTIKIPAHLPLIEEQIARIKPRLMIIDPLMAFLHGVDANKDQEVRQVLYALSMIAERHRCAIIAMRHLNKGSGTKAIYRGNSSIGVIGHARTGMIVAEDPDNNQMRVLAISKCNLASKPKSLKFFLEVEGAVCKVKWSGATHQSADDLMGPPPTEEQRDQEEARQTKAQHAIEIIESLIALDGEVEIKVAKAEANAAGISTATVEKAARILGLKMSYKTDDDGARSYFWTRT